MSSQTAERCIAGLMDLARERRARNQACEVKKWALTFLSMASGNTPQWALEILCFRMVFIDTIVKKHAKGWSGRVLGIW